jgi:hypothetical protein
MAESAQNTPGPDAAASADARPEGGVPLTPPPARSEVVDEHVETARVHKSPRIGVFLLVGAVLGVIAALILTFAFQGSADQSANTGLIYTTGQVFGFLLLVCLAVGVALGGVVAIILDRTLTRRGHDVSVDRERIRPVD